MSSRASGGALAASLITAAIIGFAGGAYFGTQAEGSGANGTNGTTPPGTGTAATTPSETPAAGGGADDGSAQETPPTSGLSLASPVTAVAPNGRIDLTGAITPAVAGVKVQLQRSVDGSPWEDFNVGEWTTAQDGTFSGNIQSQRQGTNRLRVVRVDDPSIMSNTVEVTIG